MHAFSQVRMGHLAAAYSPQLLNIFKFQKHMTPKQYEAKLAAELGT